MFVPHHVRNFKIPASSFTQRHFEPLDLDIVKSNTLEVLFIL